MTGEIEVDSTEVGGKIKIPNPPLREESVEAGLLELGRGISSVTLSEIVCTFVGGEMTLGSILTDSSSSTALGGSNSIALSTSASSGSSSSTTVLTFCPQ